MDKPLHVISLGAGVQSTTMALMAAHGEIEPMPDCAIFADTQGEPQEVYDHLKWLQLILPFPIYRVGKGNLMQDALDYRDGVSRTGANMPFFVRTESGDAAPLNRSCTRDYKVKPIERKIKQLLGLKKGARLPKEVRAVSWIGISLDEVVRMKPSRELWVENRWPLIEKRLSRWDCQLWLERNYPANNVARSACWFCPYASNERWRAIRDTLPGEWDKAVEFDRELRKFGKWKGAQGEVYLHRSLKPLDEVDLSTPEDHGQLNMFNNECEGMCGV